MRVVTSLVQVFGLLIALLVAADYLLWCLLSWLFPPHRIPPARDFPQPSQHHRSGCPATPTAARQEAASCGAGQVQEAGSTGARATLEENSLQAAQLRHATAHLRRSVSPSAKVLMQWGAVSSNGGLEDWEGATGKAGGEEVEAGCVLQGQKGMGQLCGSADNAGVQIKVLARAAGSFDALGRDSAETGLDDGSSKQRVKRELDASLGFDANINEDKGDGRAAVLEPHLSPFLPLTGRPSTARRALSLPSSHPRPESHPDTSSNALNMERSLTQDQYLEALQPAADDSLGLAPVSTLPLSFPTAEAGICSTYDNISDGSGSLCTAVYTTFASRITPASSSGDVLGCGRRGGGRRGGSSLSVGLGGGVDPAELTRGLLFAAAAAASTEQDFRTRGTGTGEVLAVSREDSEQESDCSERQDGTKDLIQSSLVRRQNSLEPGLKICAKTPDQGSRLAEHPQGQQQHPIQQKEDDVASRQHQQGWRKFLGPVANGRD